MTGPVDATDVTDAVGLIGLGLVAMGTIWSAALGAWWALETLGVWAGPVAVGVGGVLVAVAWTVEDVLL